MKALIVMGLMISTSAFAQYWGDYNYICNNSYYEEYFIKTSTPVEIAFQPIKGHPEILADMEVNQTNVSRGRCLELCLDVPFVDAFFESKKESVLSLRGIGNGSVKGTLTNPEGTVTELTCTKF